MENEETIKVCQSINARYERAAALAESIGLVEALRIMRQEDCDARALSQQNSVLQDSENNGGKTE